MKKTGGTVDQKFGLARTLGVCGQRLLPGGIAVLALLIATSLPVTLSGPENNPAIKSALAAGGGGSGVGGGGGGGGGSGGGGGVGGGGGGGKGNGKGRPPIVDDDDDGGGGDDGGIDNFGDAEGHDAADSAQFGDSGVVGDLEAGARADTSAVQLPTASAIFALSDESTVSPEEEMDLINRGWTIGN
jgi:hypothetical protein